MIDDLGVRMMNWRGLNSLVFRDVEIEQMKILHEIYTRENGPEIPLILRTQEEDGFFGAKNIVAYTLVDPVIKFEPKHWDSEMREKSGVFKMEAQSIIRKICEYEKEKQKIHISSGWKTSPEILFCEELKQWTCNVLSGIDFNSDNNIQIIKKRVRYLEEILAATNLFVPLNTQKNILHKYILEVRHVLKYSIIPCIEKELVHHDATRLLGEIKNSLKFVLQQSIFYLSRVFQKNKPEADDIEGIIKLKPTNRYMEIIKMLTISPKISQIFLPSEDERKRFIPSMSLPPNGFLAIEGDLISMSNQLVVYNNNKLSKSEAAAQPTDPLKLVLLGKNQVDRLFTDENSGVDRGFQNNECVLSFLKTVSIVEKFGELYNVLQKAQNCAKTGGTLLVYGIANSQLNSLLNTVDLLICSLRRNLTSLSQIAENRYEQYVFHNRIRPQKTPWIDNYRELNNTFSKIVKNLDDLTGRVAQMRSQANSQTLYQQFQQAKKDTEEFLQEAQLFSGSTAKLLGMEYSPIPPPDIIDFPNVDQLEYKPSHNFLGDLKYDESALNLTFEYKNLGGKQIPVPQGYGGSESGESVPEPLWHYENKEKWTPYEKQISDLLETEWSTPNGKDIINIGSSKSVNLRTYQESSQNFALLSTSKKIRRGTWYYEEQKDVWTPYEHDAASLLEDAAQNYGKFIVLVSAEPKRVVVGTISDATQYRKGKNDQITARKVLRGTKGCSLLPSKAPVYSELVRLHTKTYKK